MREKKREADTHTHSQQQSSTREHGTKLTEAIEISNNRENREELEDGKHSGGREIEGKVCLSVHRWFVLCLLCSLSTAFRDPCITPVYGNFL